MKHEEERGSAKLMEALFGEKAHLSEASMARAFGVPADQFIIDRWYVKGQPRPDVFWAALRIKPEFVGNMYTRKLDKTRTVLLSAVLVGGGALAIASATNLLGSADPNDPTIPKDTGATNRLPGRFKIPIWSLRLPYLGRP